MSYHQIHVAHSLLPCFVSDDTSSWMVEVDAFHGSDSEVSVEVSHKSMVTLMLTKKFKLKSGLCRLFFISESILCLLTPD